MVTQGKNHRQLLDALAPGDRVIAMGNVARKSGPRKNWRRRTDKRRFIARVVRVEGKKVTVRDSRGQEVTLMRELCRYEPTERMLQRRLDTIRKSRRDERLREQLGLPPFLWSTLRAFPGTPFESMGGIKEIRTRGIPGIESILAEGGNDA